jgi:phosphoglycolate phosphatase
VCLTGIFVPKKVSALRKLVLFDIDGTLIRCGKSPREAITKAMELVYGTRGGVDRYSFSGKTDPQIIFESMLLETKDDTLVREKISVVLDHYVRFLDETLKPDDISICKGIVALLEKVTQRTDIASGLLTGNVIQGAQIKLSRAGLDRYFFNHYAPVGAFGSDSWNRFDLPQVALDRASTRFEHSFKEKEIVIIGDSPSDVLCGKHLNVCSVAVATGWHKSEELKLHEPDFLFEDLSDTNKFLETVLN